MKVLETFVVVLLNLAHITLAVRRNLVESTESVLSPERGFYTWLNSLESTTVGEANYVRSEGYTLAYARVRLDDYRETPILPSSLMDDIRSGFASVRSAGLKVILRCVYNYPRGEFDYFDAQDASLAITLGHIAQLGPVFSQNQDAIAFIQGGFIGAWGEQHTSSNGNDQPGPLLSIRNALTAAFPRTRAIGWRRPTTVMRWALNDNQRKQGLYNDCFMSSPTDLGTYSSNAVERAAQRVFAASTSDRTPYGGETCAAGTDRRLTCSDILHQWRAEGCFDEVERLMGYRLWAKKAIAPAFASRGSRVKITVFVSNAGWSRVHNQRSMNIIITQGDIWISVKLQGRGGVRGIPGNNVTAKKFSAYWTVPSWVSGAFQLHLNSQDPSPLLAGKVQHNIRFANNDDYGNGVFWKEDLNMLALGLTVTVI